MGVPGISVTCLLAGGGKCTRRGEQHLWPGESWPPVPGTTCSALPKSSLGHTGWDCDHPCPGQAQLLLIKWKTAAARSRALHPLPLG